MGLRMNWQAADHGEGGSTGSLGTGPVGDVPSPRGTTSRPVLDPRKPNFDKVSGYKPVVENVRHLTGFDAPLSGAPAPILPRRIPHTWPADTEATVCRFAGWVDESCPPTQLIRAVMTEPQWPPVDPDNASPADLLALRILDGLHRLR